MATDFRAERENLLLALEREKQPSVRIEAAEQLCELVMQFPQNEREEFAPVIVRLLTDHEPMVRCAGLAMASSVLESDEALELFARHLNDRIARVRAEATGRLADLVRADARGPLAQALEDPQLEVRFEAARGMAALKHKAGLEVLVSALDDKDLRFRALAALAELNDPSVLPQVHSLFRRWLIPQFERTQAAGVLAQFGNQEGIDYLLKRAGRKWSEDRPMALELLGAVKAHAALPMLKGILQRAEDLCRGAAARGLGRLGTQEALVVLEGALTHADDELKIDIAEGLLLVDSPKARDVAKGIVVQSSEARAELDALLQE